MKKLSHGSGDDLAEIEFTYNHAGIRTKKVKKVGGITTETTEYILNGDKLVELIYTDHVNNTVDILHFYYDAQGKPAMVKHGSNMYAYVYNLQGDVLGLLDNTNALVADYRYDAWGSQGPEINDDVGHLNPFRYRGYIYDVETGLYYLKSRYYNSMICRFVNSDNIAANNAFSYTSNAPVITADETGHYREILVNKSFARTDDYTGVFIYRYCGSTRKKKAQKTGSYNIITGVGTALDLTAVYEVTYIYGTLKDRKGNEAVFETFIGVDPAGSVDDISIGVGFLAGVSAAYVYQYIKTEKEIEELAGQGCYIGFSLNSGVSLGYDRIVLDKSFSDVKLDTISEGWQLSIGIGVGLNWYHLGDSYTRIKMIKENGVYISPDQRVWIE